MGAGKWMWRTEQLTVGADRRRKEIMMGINWKVSGCSSQDPHKNGREAANRAKHVVGFLEVRTGRWKRKLKEKVARSRGIFMQEAKGGHAIGVSKH